MYQFFTGVFSLVRVSVQPPALFRLSLFCWPIFSYSHLFKRLFDIIFFEKNHWTGNFEKYMSKIINWKYAFLLVCVCMCVKRKLTLHVSIFYAIFIREFIINIQVSFDSIDFQFFFMHLWLWKDWLNKHDYNHNKLIRRDTKSGFWFSLFNFIFLHNYNVSFAAHTIKKRMESHCGYHY